MGAGQRRARLTSETIIPSRLIHPVDLGRRPIWERATHALESNEFISILLNPAVSQRPSCRSDILLNCAVVSCAPVHNTSRGVDAQVTPEYLEADGRYSRR